MIITTFLDSIFHKLVAGFYHIRDLRRVRQYTYFAVAKTVATAHVSSRLDYCNSLYHSIALKGILKLQRVQVFLARVVTSFLSHITTS